jgi:hypothetical protein
VVAAGAAEAPKGVVAGAVDPKGDGVVEAPPNSEGAVVVGVVDAPKREGVVVPKAEVVVVEPPPKIEVVGAVVGAVDPNPPKGEDVVAVVEPKVLVGAPKAPVVGVVVEGAPNSDGVVVAPNPVDGAPKGEGVAAAAFQTPFTFLV